MAGNAKKQVKYSYIPFGAGKRSCIGGAMSQVENTLALSILLRRFRPEYAGDGPPRHQRDRDADAQGWAQVPHPGTELAYAFWNGIRQHTAEVVEMRLASTDIPIIGPEPATENHSKHPPKSGFSTGFFRGAPMAECQRNTQLTANWVVHGSQMRERRMCSDR